MRALAALLLVVAAADAVATPYVQPRPPRPIPADVFAQLVDAVKAEDFPDGKIERLRAVSGGKLYLFTSSQAITILELFTFWTDRVTALRLLPLVDGKHAAAVLRYFDAAPEVVRSEARAILGARS